MGHKKSESNRSKGANARDISLSKRRAGVYKKAREVDTAFVILAPGAPALSYGRPCCEEAMRKNAESPDSFAKHMAEHEATIEKLTKEYEDMVQEIALEKKRGEELARLPKVHPLLERPIQELNLNELLTLKAFMEEKKAQIVEIAEKRGFKLSFTPPEWFGSNDDEELTVRPDGIYAGLNGHVSNGP